MGTRAYMSSSNAKQVRLGIRIGILLDKLRLTLLFRTRLPEIDDVRNPLIARAVFASQEQHGCSKGHAL
jgi:hypothetical protein